MDKCTSEKYKKDKKVLKYFIGFCDTFAAVRGGGNEPGGRKYFKP